MHYNLLCVTYTHHTLLYVGLRSLYALQLALRLIHTQHIAICSSVNPIYTIICSASPIHTIHCHTLVCVTSVPSNLRCADYTQHTAEPRFHTVNISLSCYVTALRHPKTLQDCAYPGIHYITLRYAAYVHSKRLCATGTHWVLGAILLHSSETSIILSLLASLRCTIYITHYSAHLYNLYFLHAP